MARRGSDAGASLSDCSQSIDESVGGVPVDGLLSLVRALIGCGASPDVAVQSATTMYTSHTSVGTAGSEVSGASSSRARRSQLRHEVWGTSMAALPYKDGQCYLHPIRWGRRAAYAAALKSNPAFSDFVAMLRPGDLNVEVAKEMFLFRISPDTACGSRVVYHIASVCVEGVLVASVYDAIAGFQRLYPWVNKECVLDGPGVESIEFVGTVGALRDGVHDRLRAVRLADAHQLGGGGVSDIVEVPEGSQVTDYTLEEACDSDQLFSARALDNSTARDNGGDTWGCVSPLVVPGERLWLDDLMTTDLWYLRDVVVVLDDSGYQCTAGGKVVVIPPNHRVVLSNRMEFATTDNMLELYVAAGIGVLHTLQWVEPYVRDLDSVMFSHVAARVGGRSNADVLMRLAAGASRFGRDDVLAQLDVVSAVRGCELQWELRGSVACTGRFGAGRDERLVFVGDGPLRVAVACVPAGTQVCVLERGDQLDVVMAPAGRVVGVSVVRDCD